MAKRLSHKEKGFVNDIADGKTGTQAVLNNYDTKSKDVAGVIAAQNLAKLRILDALKEKGFDSDNAKRVVGQILNDETEEPNVRISAADKVFRVFGDYAPEKRVSVNVEADEQVLREIIASIKNG